MVCLYFDTTGRMATAMVKMETLDSGIGSRSPTPDSNLSHTNSSKATKVATHSNHINNNSHNNTSSDGAQNNKTKVSDKGDTSATKPATTSTATATGSNGTGGGGSNSNSSTNASSNSHNNQGNNASSNNSKTYRDYRHSSGHGQYKKYGNHQNHHYGYGSNVHYHHRYNGNRHYGNKYYNSTTNYHHHNNNYQGQSYQHHQYTHQNHHHYNHHGHVQNNNNASNSNGNSNGNNSSNSNSHANSHHHNGQMNHQQTQYFNIPSGPPVVHHQNHHRNATPQVFISSDQVDALSWTRRGGESATNANWSSPGVDTNDAAPPAAVPISLNLSVLNKGFYSPSPQNVSPATSPSTTDSSDAYSLQEENGSGTVTVTAAGITSSIIHHSNCVDDVHYTSSNSGSLMDTTLNGTVLTNHNGTAAAGYSYQPFPYHPSAGVYAYPGPNNHIITGGGRTYAHPNHHQLINHQGLLMPADSFTMGKADSSISSGNSDKALEWSDDGMLFNTLIGTDREEFPPSSSTDRSTTPGGPDLIYAPQLFYTSTAAHYQPANKKRFYSGASSMSGKLSPVPQNHRFHYPNRKMPFYGFPREFYEDLDPEEYVRAFSKFGEVKEMPAALSQNPQCDSLSEEIWLKFHANQQTTETFRKKMELWRDVYRILRNLNNNSHFKQDPRNFPTFGLQVVGSTMSGFGSNTSDVDMCLLVRGTEVDQRYEAVDKLQVLYGALSGTQGLDNVELIYAKVPILKFRDPKRYLEVDLNCNNYVGIRNTHLLYCYSQADWRLKPLVLVVKLWAHHHGINDAKNMTISSYSLVLMVIHFLQSGVEEPVLPNLQKLHPDKFSSSSNILNVKINEVLPVWQSKNKENIGNLLIQFLEYYTHKFDYNEHAVSIRFGGTIPIKLAAGFKAAKNDPHQWKYLCIEEPFDRTNTARSVYDRDTFDKILGIFNLSYQRLLASRNLESIFTHISESDARTMSVLIR